MFYCRYVLTYILAKRCTGKMQEAKRKYKRKKQRKKHAINEVGTFLTFYFRRPQQNIWLFLVLDLSPKMLDVYFVYRERSFNTPNMLCMQMNR